MVFGLDDIIWRFIRSRGAGLSGDEPHYLVLARMLLHGSLHPLKFYQRDVKAHVYYNWPPDLLVHTANWHAYRGPHGPVSIHGLGLPVLLAPFVGFAGPSGGVLGLMALEAVGWVYLTFRAVELAGLRRPARMVTVLAMAGPAVWIASSQLYPDLIAGLLIAIAIVDLATFESTRCLDPLGTIGIGVSIGLLPWLHIKNLVPAGIILAAVFLVATHRGAWTRVAVAAGVGVGSWLTLLTYNLWGFGRVLGEPQPSPLPSWAALTHGVGLILDRHQGLVIQVPTVILGIVGLFMARRVVPRAAAATALSVAALIYLNASYVGVPYGGSAVAGRFSWSEMAPLLMWVSFVLVRLRPLHRLYAVGGTITACWVLQLIPILADHHAYYNAQMTGAPWDLSVYPGWWGPVNKVLPVLVPNGPIWGRPEYGVIVALFIAVSIGAFGVLAGRVPLLRGSLVIEGMATCAVLVAILISVVSPPLPTKPLIYAGDVVGSPIVAGAHPTRGATVPLQGIGPGTYSVTVRYKVTGSASITSYCTTGTPTQPGSTTSTMTATVGSQNNQATVRLHCSTGLIWLKSSVQPNARLDIVVVALRKTAD